MMWGQLCRAWGPIVQGLGALTGCYSRVVQTRRVPDDSEVVRRVCGLIKGLETLGQALSVFAAPHCCNNPRCVNTSGLSEASTVSGKGCICSVFKVARFCGKPCQVAQWKTVHKPVCRMLCQDVSVGACGGPGIMPDAPRMLCPDVGAWGGPRVMQDAPRSHAQFWGALGWILLGFVSVVLWPLFAAEE